MKKYQNKGDNNWQLTSNKYPCWHKTVFLFMFSLFLSCTGSGSTRLAPLRGPGQLDRAWRIMRACPPVCFSLCFVFFCPQLLSAFLFHATAQHAKWASSAKASLSTAVNKAFRGISSYATVMYLFVKVIKSPLSIKDRVRIGELHNMFTLVFICCLHDIRMIYDAKVKVRELADYLLGL